MAYRQKGNNAMKKKTIIAAMITIALAGYAIYWAFYDMSRLPTGELISEVQSPGGTYTLKSYRTDGGATTSYAIRGELKFNTENKKPKNIYWEYRVENAEVEWLDEDTVMINGVQLDVPDEKYDFRRKQ